MIQMSMTLEEIHKLPALEGKIALGKYYQPRMKSKFSMSVKEVSDQFGMVFTAFMRERNFKKSSHFLIQTMSRFVEA